MATTTQYKKVQENVLDSAHKLFLAGLGTVKTVGDEGGELFNRLVDRGRDLETRGRKELSSWKKEVEKKTAQGRERFDRVGDRIDEQVTGALHRLGVPSRDEIQTLTHRVEELSRKVDRMAAVPKAEAKPKTRTKAQPKAKVEVKPKAEAAPAATT